MFFHLHNGAKNASVLGQQAMKFQGHLTDNKKTMFISIYTFCVCVNKIKQI